MLGPSGGVPEPPTGLDLPVGQLLIGDGAEPPIPNHVLFGLESRRTAALGTQVADAQNVMDEAHQAAHLDGVRRMVSAIPNPDKPHRKAVQAFEDYLDAARAQDQAVRELYAEAKDLPDYAHGRPGQEKPTGWPAYATPSQGQWNTESRIGHVQIDDRPIRRPDLTKEAERLAEIGVRQARTRWTPTDRAPSTW